MYRLVLYVFGFLAIVSSALGATAAVPRSPRGGQATKLRPISILDYEAAMGLHRRSSETFSSLNPNTQAEIINGSPGENGQMLLANMTLYGPDGLLIIMMERFEPLTTSVDCKGDDGEMSLTFRSEDAFRHALQQWSYINDNEDGKFLLIANHAGCGPDDKRQPYFISKITEDAAKLTTNLAAQPAPWSEVAGTYDLDFGQALLSHNPQQLKQRGFWGDVTDVGKDVLNGAQGNLNQSPSITVPMNVGRQGQKTNIYTDYKGRLTLDCTDCFITGSFQVTGHISVQHFNLQDLRLTASPNNLQAKLALEATITSSKSPDSLQYTKELFSFPVPSAGIEVEGIFKLGAILSYDVGVSSSFSGSATVDFGIQAGLPNSARVVADVQNPDQSSATGFGVNDLTPIFDITKESASVTLAAFSQPKLSLGVELIKVGNIDVAITVKLPEISSTFSVAYEKEGVCSQTSGASQTGVKLDSKVDVQVDLQIDANLGNDEDAAKPSWSKKLWGVSKPLGSQCFPLAIPGLEGKVSSSALSPGSSSAVASNIASAASPSSETSRAAAPVKDTKATVKLSSSSQTPTSTKPKTSSTTTAPANLPSTPKPATSSPITSSQKPSPTSSVKITSSAVGGGGGGGGCRMVKRFGKRVVIC